jgi:hypothetical protein
MRTTLQATVLTSLCFIFPGSAMALVAAPGPEIGDGAVGSAVAAAALLAITTLRFFRRPQPKA